MFVAIGASSTSALIQGTIAYSSASLSAVGR